jgi:L-asparaginase II
MTEPGSFTIEIARGEVVESRHRIHAVVADRHGHLQVWGDRDRPTIARSAIKAIQALPLVATGAADAFGLHRHELALACASHGGEAEHVAAVLAWLGRIGLGEQDLECGPDRPLGRLARRDWYRRAGEKRLVLNCCSGKHTGFLTVARHLHLPTAGYIRPTSPVQELVTRAVAACTGLDLPPVPTGIDGCGIPVFAVPLERLAFAMARLVDPVDLPDDLAAAAPRLVDAAQDAFWVSGTGRTEVQVTEAATQPLVIKTGAEGVFMAALPERGLGMVIKAEDGASRASQAAITGLLRHLGALPPLDRPVVVTNKAGDISGEVRAGLAPPLQARLRPVPTAEPVAQPA